MTATEIGKRPPSLWWFAVAAVVFVLGLVPFVWMLATTVQGIADYEVHAFESARSTTLSVEDDQVAIFSVYEGPGTVRCSGAGPDGTGSLDHPSTSLNFTVGSTEWGRVAVTPQSWTEGEYTVTCTVASPGSGNPVPLLGYADNPSIASTAVGFAVAVGIAILAALLALTIAIVAGVRRYNANKPRLPDRPEFPPAPPAA